MKKFFGLLTAFLIGGAAMAQSKSAVVYFSATGTTKAVAQQISKITGSDIIEIQPKEPYSQADLDWTDKKSRTTKECNALNKIRPEMASKIDVSKYKTIYPFCTSGSSPVGSSATNLAKKAAKADWKKGKRFSGKVSEGDIKNWK